MKRFSFTAIRFRYISLMAIFLASFLSSTAQALLPGDYLSNGIYFHSPNGKTVCRADAVGSSLDLPSLVGNNNAEKIWRFLIDKGLSPEQAAGVMGNIQLESGFDPNLEEGEASYSQHTVRPVGYGIVQWTGPRRTALESAAKEQGIAVSDLSFQLAYMHQESQSRQVTSAVASQGFGNEGDNEWETLKKQKTIEDATVFWHNSFEVSNNAPQQVLEVRGGYAQNAYNSFKTLATAVALPEAGSGGLRRDDCDTFAGGDLKQTLLAYAWPKYTDPEYPLNPEPKPAYLEAATKADSEGKWVGGGKAEIGVPGIDCGGFVSLLLVNSGFEPNYNYGLGSGAGNQTTQQAWAQEHWTFLGTSDTINVSDLKPGDVAYTSGHTFVYVGDVEGFESKYASASYSYSGRASGKYPAVSWRAPMAGYESAALPGYVWYGKRGSDSGTQSKPVVKNEGDN